MARKQGSSLDLNWYELLKLRFQNGASDPSGGAGAGRAYFSTATADLMVADGSNFRALAWADESAGGYTNEEARDAIAAAFAAGSHTGITVTPDDGTDSISLAVTVTQYTDELAQDAVGTILVDSGRIDFTYADGTPSITADIVAASIANSYLAVMAANTVKANVTAGSAVPTDVTRDSFWTWLDDATGFATSVLAAVNAGTVDADTLGGDSKATIISTAVAQIVDSAPTTLDTLNELAAALGDDAAFSTTVTTALSNRAQAYSANIGDGSTTAIVVTHSLGTRDIICSVRDAGSPYDGVDVEWQATSTTTATFTFAVAPTSNQYRVTIHAKP
jgi:hypothetical protein